MRGGAGAPEIAMHKLASEIEIDSKFSCLPGGVVREYEECWDSDVIIWMCVPSSVRVMIAAK
jgi:hypothetical protein